MKDYASMSDVDVARMVSAYLWGSVYSLDGVVLHSETSEPFDPCNNPADAWPIITENRISIIYLDENKWGCRGAGYKSTCRAINSNALRCAMIVFLMMKEGEK